MRELQLLLDGGTFFEGARWHDGKWWVSDFFTNSVLTVTESGETEHVATIDVPSGLGWLPSGDLLVVSMTGHELWRVPPGGEPTLHADLHGFTRGEANDLLVDRQGRAYVTNYGFDMRAGEKPGPAKLVRVDPDGSVSVAAEDVLYPNGIVLSADERTLIVAETIASRLTAFDVADDGTLSNRRVWGQLAETRPLTSLEDLFATVEFAPDGCTLDEDGFIWVADALHKRCCRVAPGGEIVEEIPVPDEDLVFYAAMLGGPDGRTLLMCLSPDFRQERPAGETASALYTTRVESAKAGMP